MADFSGDLKPAIENAAGRYGPRPQAYQGNVKLLPEGAEEAATDAETRAEAVRRYQGIIDSSRLVNSSLLWQELRDSYERAFKETETDSVSVWAPQRWASAFAMAAMFGGPERRFSAAPALTTNRISESWLTGTCHASRCTQGWQCRRGRTTTVARDARRRRDPEA